MCWRHPQVRSFVQMSWGLAKVAWNVFAALCIVAGGFADGPGLAGAFRDTGVPGAISLMVSTAMNMISAEPLGFVALVVAVALAFERARPWLAWLRSRLAT